MKASVPVVVLSTDYAGLAVARSLGRLGVPVYGVHNTPHCPAARSRYWRQNFTWPRGQVADEAARDWLRELGRRIGGRPLLVPTADRGCLFVNDHADALRESFRFPDQPPGLARALSCKRSMDALCRQHGVPTARTLFPRSREDVLAYAREGPFPVMLKGIDTQALLRRTGTRMVAVQDAATLLALYERMETPASPNLMLQEYLPGGSEQVWMFNGYFDRDSVCLFGLTGRKLRQYPAHAGVTSLGACVANEDVTRQTCALMQAVGYRGILDIGFKYDARTQQYKLLDVNPRLGATFRLFTDSTGMDVVRALYLDLTGQRVTPGRPLEGRKWVVEQLDLVSSLRYLRDGSFSPREWVRSFSGVQEGAWFARDDLRPLLALGGGAPAKLLRRLRAPPGPPV